MIRNICPGDPSDIKCCVRSQSGLRQSGARPASSTLDSNNIHIPGIVRPNLPDTIMVPDTSIFDPQDQSKVDEIFLQRSQSQMPSADDGGSDPMSDEDPFFLYYPEEEFLVSFAEDPNPGSDSAMNIFPSSDPSSDDDELAADLFAEDQDQESPGFLGQG